MWAMTIEWVHLYKYMYFFSDSYTITTVSIIYTYITVLYYLLISYYSWFAATNSRLILVRSKFWKIMLGGFPIFDTKIWDHDISGWNSHGVDWHGRAQWCPFLCNFHSKRGHVTVFYSIQQGLCLVHTVGSVWFSTAASTDVLNAQNKHGWS